MHDHREAAAAFDLGGRTALVTGAASGLGRAIAVGLARHGADVALADVNAAGMEETAALIAPTGRRSVAIEADMSDPDSIARLFEQIDAFTPSLDALVNNAGIGPKARPEELELAEWERTLAVDLTATLICSQHAARRMIARGGGGGIVNISSIAGSSGVGRGSTAYATAKAGVIGLTRELAIEWARHGIRVNAIQPCQFRTPALQAYMDSPNVENVVKRWIDGIPLGRVGEPEEIVGPIVFLLSDAASMVTGHALPVDGGNLALNAGGSHDW